MYHYAGEYEKAVTHLARTVEATPEDFKEWGRLGESERLIPDNESRARAAFEKAVHYANADLEVNPNSWETHGYLSVYLAYLARFDEAQASLARMFELNPGQDPMTQYWGFIGPLGARGR